jgi:hypothetical protein
VVETACKRVGLSASSAYAFRNRRSGRAFAIGWDSVLIHRARTRLADEVLGRSIAGCTETVRRDGEVVAERHRFDNRLSMAVLTRLDKLAEKEAAREEQLRAVSEDFEDLLDCIEEGGDAEAFVEARRPKPEPEPEEKRRLDDSIWTGKDGLLWTIFPPPENFAGLEEGVYDGVSYYARTLSEREEAALDGQLLNDLKDQARSRDLYFGFVGGTRPPEPWLDELPPLAASREQRRGGDNDAAAAASPQPSTSSTYCGAPGGRREGDDHG